MSRLALSLWPRLGTCASMRPDVRRSHDGGLVSGLDPSLLRSRRPAPSGSATSASCPGSAVPEAVSGGDCSQRSSVAILDWPRDIFAADVRGALKRPAAGRRRHAHNLAPIIVPLHVSWGLGPRIGSANGDRVHPRLRGRDREDGHRDRIPGHASGGRPGRSFSLVHSGRSFVRPSKERATSR